jgi:hypothetical protein
VSNFSPRFDKYRDRENSLRGRQRFSIWPALSCSKKKIKNPSAKGPVKFVALLASVRDAMADCIDEDVNYFDASLFLNLEYDSFACGSRIGVKRILTHLKRLFLLS